MLALQRSPRRLAPSLRGHSTCSLQRGKVLFVTSFCFELQTHFLIFLSDKHTRSATLMMKVSGEWVSTGASRRITESTKKKLRNTSKHNLFLFNFSLCHLSPLLLPVSTRRAIQASGTWCPYSRHAPTPLIQFISFQSAVIEQVKKGLWAAAEVKSRLFRYTDHGLSLVCRRALSLNTKKYALWWSSLTHQTSSKK